MANFDRMLKKAHLFVALDRLTELRVRGRVFVLAFGILDHVSPTRSRKFRFASEAFLNTLSFLHSVETLPSALFKVLAGRGLPR